MRQKVFTIITLLCLIAFSGCAEVDKFQPRRSVQDNVFFSSSNPQIRMKVNPDFTYLGMTEMTHEANQEGGLVIALDDDEINSRQFSYLFAKTTATGKLLKGVVIRLTLITGDPNQWSPDLLAGAENVLETGKVRIEDKSSHDGILASREPYRYGIFTGSRVLLSEEDSHITAKGITIPRCLLVKTLEKATSLGNKSRMHILYFEDIGADACNALTEASTPSGDQMALVTSFVGRSNSAIQFMASEETDTTKRLITAAPTKEQKAPPAVKAEETTPAELGEKPDIGSKLHTLKQLLDEDLITKEDFERKKQELLDAL
ncbi:MAG: SHOCT domain-containing protein [Deltaproteobacteria bacterium]|nr:SHOCT domain-containing protein [Deltaproteobacteria bacterium]